MSNRNKSHRRFTSGGHDERPEHHSIEECTCKPMLDGGTLPRPKGLPLPIVSDPECPIHGIPDKEDTE